LASEEDHDAEIMEKIQKTQKRLLDLRKLLDCEDDDAEDDVDRRCDEDIVEEIMTKRLEDVPIPYDSVEMRKEWKDSVVSQIRWSIVKKNYFVVRGRRYYRIGTMSAGSIDERSIYMYMHVFDKFFEQIGCTCVYSDVYEHWVDD